MSHDTPHTDRLVGQFVDHWGHMARAWGINTSMGELFALLYATGSDWTADELKDRLGVSRGNVSMNLRELVSWGVVHRVQRAGERRERFRAETDVWTLFSAILRERKQRELDPTLRLLDQAARAVADDPELSSMRERVEALRVFFRTIDALASTLLKLEPGDLDEIVALIRKVDLPA